MGAKRGTGRARIYKKPAHATMRGGIAAKFNRIIERVDQRYLAQFETWLEQAVDGDGNLKDDFGPFASGGGANTYDPSDIRWMDKMWVDPARTSLPETGIYVRAKRPLPEGSAGRAKFESVDIAHLTVDALRVWMRSRGGNNQWAESVVEILLGHGVEARSDEDQEEDQEEELGAESTESGDDGGGAAEAPVEPVDEPIL